MNSEKQNNPVKPITPVKPTEDQGARAQNAGAKNIDAQRHPEEQNVDPKAFSQKDKTNLNGTPANQKV